MNVTGDLRAASLLDRSLALGAYCRFQDGTKVDSHASGMSKKLIWLKDVANSTKNHRTLHTKSDVLSLVQGPVRGFFISRRIRNSFLSTDRTLSLQALEAARCDYMMSERAEMPAPNFLGLVTARKRTGSLVRLRI